MITLAERLKHWREHYRISQRRLSELSGVSNAYICQIETGKFTNVSIDTIDLLSTSLQIKSCWLAWGVGKPQPR